MLRSIVLCISIGIMSIFNTALAEDSSMVSNAFLDNGVIPVLYTCDGQGISPQISWTNSPANSKSFAMVLSDTSKPGADRIHWVIYNLPPKTSELSSDLKTLPGSAKFGKNSDGKLNYISPCPARGNVGKYTFTLYTLDTTLNVPSEPDAQTIMTAMKGHILQSNTLTAIYSRWPVPLNGK